jgi:hypothetical protein
MPECRALYDTVTVVQPRIDKGIGIIETSTNRGCQTLRKPADVAFARKSNAGQLQPGTAIDKDLVRTVDKDDGHPRLVQ